MRFPACRLLIYFFTYYLGLFFYAWRSPLIRCSHIHGRKKLYLIWIFYLISPPKNRLPLHMFFCLILIVIRLVLNDLLVNVCLDRRTQGGKKSIYFSSRPM